MRNNDEGRPIIEIFSRVYYWVEISLSDQLPLLAEVPGLKRNLANRAKHATHWIIDRCKDRNLDRLRGKDRLEVLQCLVVEEMDYSFINMEVGRYIKEFLPKKELLALPHHHK